MRLTRILTGTLLTAAALLGGAATAVAGPSGKDAPTQAGTTFRTAAAIDQGETATADASTGDYLYWVFPADVGQRVTVKATATLPQANARHGASTWQIDVYDGLRRRQACMYGSQTRQVPADAPSVELACTLRPVRSLAEPWSNDPLPGSYYIRLTAVDLPQQDLGLPLHAQVKATSSDVGGAYAVDGSLASPLVPGAGGAGDGATSLPDQATIGAPDGGWSSGWWSDRWVWTVGGGVLAALAAVGGYSLTRGSGRPRISPNS
jgi:hypothetical protein